MNTATEKKVKLFLITGHGRSGTNYMGRLFQYFGFSVGMQAEGSDGMAHNYPAKYWPLSEARDRFQYLVQVVRNPWKVAESTYLAEYSLPKQNAKLLAKIDNGTNTKLAKAIRSIVLWNQAIAAAKPDLTVKVEEADMICKGWIQGLGLTLNLGVMPPPKNVNHRTAGAWDLDGVVPWDELPREYFEMFKEHCRTYGYSDKP